MFSPGGSYCSHMVRRRERITAGAVGLALGFALCAACFWLGAAVQ